MKAVLQRVTEAQVGVAGRVVGEIGRGLVVLVCVEPDDGDNEAELFAAKIARMRIFADAAGKVNLSLLDTGGSALVVSQFTLCGDWRKGNRPSFSGAAAPEKAEELYASLCRRLAALGVPVETGVFAAAMTLALVNDGPVTMWMDSGDTRRRERGGSERG